MIKWSKTKVKIYVCKNEAKWNVRSLIFLDSSVSYGNTVLFETDVDNLYRLHIKYKEQLS